MAERQSQHLALVLASGSRTRYDILKSAGLSFTVVPADVDEEAVRSKLAKSNAAPRDVALALARAKALAVAAAHPSETVIGADQILALDGEIFTKTPDRDSALKSLQKLRGKTHELFSATAIAVNGKIDWDNVESAKMTMRDFSDAFATDYLVRIGETAFSSVGAYQIEGPGIQLFEKIDGDFFTILGLPLLPLLNYLRSIKELEQ